MQKGVFVGLSVLSWSGFKLFVRSKPSLTKSSLRFCRFVSKEFFRLIFFFWLIFLLLVSFCVFTAKWITKKLWFSMQNAKNKYLICNSSYVLARSSQSEWIYDKISCKKKILEAIFEAAVEIKIENLVELLLFWNLCFGFQKIVLFQVFMAKHFFQIISFVSGKPITLNWIAWQNLITSLIF